MDAPRKQYNKPPMSRIQGCEEDICSRYMNHYTYVEGQDACRGMSVNDSVPVTCVEIVDISPTNKLAGCCCMLHII